MFTRTKTTGKTTFFAVDLGATSGRTILATYDGARVEMKEITRFANPMIPLGGHLYWNIAGLYNEVLRGLREIADKGIQIESIGIDTWGCDFAFFGTDGQDTGIAIISAVRVRKHQRGFPSDGLPFH